MTDFIIFPERKKEREKEKERKWQVELVNETRAAVPALSPTESGMKREGSEVLERKEEKRWLELMGGSCSRAWR